MELWQPVLILAVLGLEKKFGHSLLVADQFAQPVDIEVIIIASIPDNLVDYPIEPVNIITPAITFD